uniref:Disease resistance R13L4/SHOC-2-like LRR domain-containing protein n=1 Tax=Aegilops tauschii TaxID=37682 RepID=M8AZZ6_AEGTA
MARLQSCEYKVHRLSLKSGVGGATSETLATSMSQVRSYARFGESKYIPHLSQFKYLRVLFFEFPDGWDMIVDLTAIGHLFLLRYLKVLARLADVALPTEIRGLVHLESLELSCRSVQSFPSDITRLANLFHLKLPYGAMLPEGIQNMKSIRTLHYTGMLKNSLEDIKGLSELTNLKELMLCTPYEQCLTVEHVNALVSSIQMLRDLKHLSLVCWGKLDDYGSRLNSLVDPPRLEVLNLATWELSRAPRWIGELCCLRVVSLHVLHMSSDEVRVLGDLPSLVDATIRVSELSQDKVVVGTGLFPVLEYFFFRSDEDVTAYLSFEAGAMPKLRTLNVAFGWQEWRGGTPFGMECLPCLQDIHVQGKVMVGSTRLFPVLGCFEIQSNEGATSAPCDKVTRAKGFSSVTVMEVPTKGIGGDQVNTRQIVFTRIIKFSAEQQKVQVQHTTAYTLAPGVCAIWNFSLGTQNLPPQVENLQAAATSSGSFVSQ